MFYVYFLKSIKNGKIYVGYSKINPEDRLKQHNQKSNKWTRENGHLILLYFEKYLCEQDAIMREKFYKSGFGRQVRNIIIRAASAKGRPASGGG